MKLFFYKLWNWEYWSMPFLYAPIYVLWLYYTLKTKHLFFFNAVNPTMRNGGFINNRKQEIYDLIPQRYYPKTRLVRMGNDFDPTHVVDSWQVSFPCIAKPDIGLRGSAVKKITDLADWKAYHAKATFDYLVQDLIPYEQEIGIFYVRMPNEARGKITGIVKKELLVVTGDGKSSIETLLRQNPRYELQLKVLRKEYHDSLDTVLPEGEIRNLVPYGNHARGAKFLDISHAISPALTKVIDEMCQQIDGFYYGRMDVMFHNWEDLERGQSFAVVELNGAMSEPTHMYDPQHSIFFAWRELARHISYLFQISQINHQRGTPYLPFRVGVRELYQHQQHLATLAKF